MQFIYSFFVSDHKVPQGRKTMQYINRNKSTQGAKTSANANPVRIQSPDTDTD